MRRAAISRQFSSSSEGDARLAAFARSAVTYIAPMLLLCGATSFYSHPPRLGDVLGLDRGADPTWQAEYMRAHEAAAASRDAARNASPGGGASA
jgi:hypothetical protein